MSVVLLIGGARSGKSSLAVDIGRRFDGDVVFIATAEAGDAVMAARIARHREDRPREWRVVEEPVDVVAVDALGAGRALVVIDCLTLWLANLVGRDRYEAAILAEVAALAERAAVRDGPVVIVTNEVGLGVVPISELGRRFRDLQGRANALTAAQASRVLLVVAGRALELAPVAVEDVLKR